MSCIGDPFLPLLPFGSVSLIIENSVPLAVGLDIELHVNLKADDRLTAGQSPV